MTNDQWLSLLLPALLFAAGCRAVPELPPANLSSPGWRVQQGQAVWRPQREAPEIAGELLLASHPDGRSLVQFTKTPLPVVIAQTTANAWQIHFVPHDRRVAGRGRPSSRFGWFQLAPALAGQTPAAPWHFKHTGPQSWRLQNPRTGETLAGYLAP